MKEWLEVFSEAIIRQVYAKRKQYEIKLSEGITPMEAIRQVYCPHLSISEYSDMCKRYDHDFAISPEKT